MNYNETPEAKALREAFIEGQRIASASLDKWIKLTGEYPLTEVKPSCPKCGSRDTNRIYHRGKEDCYSGFFQFKQSSTEEHLHHECRGCSYDWIGTVLGQKLKGEHGSKGDGPTGGSH